MSEFSRVALRCLVCALFSASLACTGAIDPTGPAAAAEDPFNEVEPGDMGGPLPGAITSGIRRLAPDELDSTLQDLLGGARPSSAVSVPGDEKAPFDNDYRVQESSRALVEGLDLLVKDQVAALLADPRRRELVVGCSPAIAADWPACFRAFVTKFGRRALRRPLDANEIERTMKFLDLAQKDQNFYTGVELALRAFLQNPEFLYRVETGDPVGPDVFRLGSYEMATRLSYLLWGTTPDEALLDLASKGQLDTPAEVRGVVEKMIVDPRARRVISRFHAMWLGFDSIPLSPAERAETDALISRVIFERKLPWSALLTSEETFVTREIAEVYGLAPPSTLKPGGPAQWVRYPSPDRRGILSHSAFLAVGIETPFTTPILRGKNVRENLLCDSLGRPSDVTVSNTTESPCIPDQLRAKTEAGGCAACHSRMNPIGIGLLKYDGSGRRREFEPDEMGKDNPRCPISAQGSVSGLGTDTAFNGPAELGALLARTGRFVECGGTQLYRFAIGRKDLDEDDQRLMRFMLGTAGADSVRLHEAILRFTSTKAFFHRREEKIGG
jgi:hypothetical protein